MLLCSENKKFYSLLMLMTEHDAAPLYKLNIGITIFRVQYHKKWNILTYIISFKQKVGQAKIKQAGSFFKSSVNYSLAEID